MILFEVKSSVKPLLTLRELNASVLAAECSLVYVYGSLAGAILPIEATVLYISFTDRGYRLGVNRDATSGAVYSVLKRHAEISVIVFIHTWVSNRLGLDIRPLADLGKIARISDRTFRRGVITLIRNNEVSVLVEVVTLDLCIVIVLPYLFTGKKHNIGGLTLVVKGDRDELISGNELGAVLPERLNNKRPESETVLEVLVKVSDRVLERLVKPIVIDTRLHFPEGDIRELSADTSLNLKRGYTFILVDPPGVSVDHIFPAVNRVDHRLGHSYIASGYIFHLLVSEHSTHYSFQPISQIIKHISHLKLLAP